MQEKSLLEHTCYFYTEHQLLKTVDTLSLIPEVRTDPRYREMVERLKGKQDADGHWRTESVNKSWSIFDFGQKKTASPWITFLAIRVLLRTEGLAS